MTGVLEIFYYSPSSPWDSIHFYFVCFLSVVVIFQSSSSLVFPSYSFHFAIECISQVLIFPLLHFSILLVLHVSYFFAETLFLWWGFLFISFVCFKHVYWSIFKTPGGFIMLYHGHIALTYLLSMLAWFSFFHSVWELLDLDVSDFFLKSVHFEYYDMILWILFKPPVLANILWHCSSNKSVDTPSLLPGGSGSPNSSHRLHWRWGVGAHPQWRCKSWPLIQPSLDFSRWGEEESVVSLQSGRPGSWLFTCSLLACMEIRSVSAVVHLGGYFGSVWLQ